MSENADPIQEKIVQALSKNSEFLNNSRTIADNTALGAQVKLLTRQVNAVIRLLSGNAYGNSTDI